MTDILHHPRSNRFSAMVHAVATIVVEHRRRLRKCRTIERELSLYSAAELRELGISAYDITAVARDSTAL